MNFPVLFRHAQRPRLMLAEEYRRYRWYEMGSTMEPFAAAYRGASQDGFECRMAYNAGVIARTFGVDLSEILNLSN